MGTRSLTRFIDDKGNVLAAMYRQFDGYPSGHGQELARFLLRDGKPRRVVQGFTRDDAKDRAFNGIECLAAECIGHFKCDAAREARIGGFYLMPVTTTADECDAEFVYDVTVTAASPRVEVRDPEKCVFKGNAAELLEWCTNEENA